MASADHFERALHKSLAAGDLIVDLSGCQFLDSAGLGALVSARREADRRDRRLLLAAPSPEAAKLLDLTGIGNAIATHESVEAAATALNSPPSRD